MPRFVATYDLKETKPDPHTIFLKHAVARGWKLWIEGVSGVSHRLPNTTLQGVFIDLSAAEAALKSARVATQREIGKPVVMKKWIIVRSSTSRFNSDERQKR